MKWVACFDISDDKKRKLVAETLEEFGVRVQRSVFEIEVSRANFRKILKKIEKIIDKKEDSVRFYAQSLDTIKKSVWFGFGDEPFFGKDVYYF